MTRGSSRVLAAVCSVSTLALTTATAQATPIPRYEELLAHPTAAQPPKLPLAKPLSAPPFKSTKITAIDTKVGLDPASGDLQGHADIGVTAVASVSSLWLLIDQGLSISGATASGTSVSVSSQPAYGYTYASLTFSPPIAAGTSVSVAVDYAGKLACAAQNCKAGLPLAYVSEGSAMPSIVDQDSVGGLNAWGASRTLELTVPLGIDVVASGDLVSKTETGSDSVTLWKIPGFHSYGGNVAMMGALGTLPVSGLAPSTDVWALESDQKYVSDMGSWMKSIIPFLDAQAGKPLPYAGLKVFKLPLGWLNIFRGTAGYGLTLLSEDYASGSVGYFQETLAHENAHQWWGVLVSPTDALVTRWLVEGLATLSQIDYAAANQAVGLGRDEYLARRYREHWMLVRYLGDATLPLVVAKPADVPQDSVANTLWAYIRSSALLEHLRVVVGDDVFASVLRGWADSCAEKFCDSADFRTLLENASGQSFATAFAQHVYSGGAVEPRVSFSQPAGGKLSVSLQGTAGLTLPLELFVTLESGELVRRRAVFEGATPVELDVTEPVRSVRPNPRHDGFVWSRSAVSGDLDFDAEVDGLDVIHCAWRSGRTAAPSQPGGEGIWSSDLDFDPRCDQDGDGEISDADLSVVTGAFGTVKGGA